MKKVSLGTRISLILMAMLLILAGCSPGSGEAPKGETAKRKQLKAKQPKMSRWLKVKLLKAKLIKVSRRLKVKLLKPKQQIVSRQVKP